MADFCILLSSGIIWSCALLPNVICTVEHRKTTPSLELYFQQRYVSNNLTLIIKETT